MTAAIVPIGIGGVIFFGLWFWAVLDCISTDSVLVRNLPKTTWLFVVIFLSMPGALAWLLLGRPEGASLSVGGGYRPPDYRTQRWGQGPEDSADWEARKDRIAKPTPAIESNAAKERKLLEWEAELKKREAALDGEPPASDPSASDPSVDD